MIRMIVEVPLSDLQAEKGMANKGVNPCLICGKEIKGNAKHYIHLLTNGNIVSYSGDDIEGSQGFFPVGSECAKKLILKFSFSGK